MCQHDAGGRRVLLPAPAIGFAGGQIELRALESLQGKAVAAARKKQRNGRIGARAITGHSTIVSPHIDDAATLIDAVEALAEPHKALVRRAHERAHHAGHLRGRVRDHRHPQRAWAEDADLNRKCATARVVSLGDQLDRVVAGDAEAGKPSSAADLAVACAIAEGLICRLLPQHLTCRSDHRQPPRVCPSEQGEIAQRDALIRGPLRRHRASQPSQAACRAERNRAHRKERSTGERH